MIFFVYSSSIFWAAFGAVWAAGRACCRADKAPVPIVTAIAAAPTIPAASVRRTIRFDIRNPPDGWAARAKFTSFPDDARGVDETREVCGLHWKAMGQRTPP